MISSARFIFICICFVVLSENNAWQIATHSFLAKAKESASSKHRLGSRSGNGLARSAYFPRKLCAFPPGSALPIGLQLSGGSLASQLGSEVSFGTIDGTQMLKVDFLNRYRDASSRLISSMPFIQRLTLWSFLFFATAALHSTEAAVTKLSTWKVNLCLPHINFFYSYGTGIS